VRTPARADKPLHALASEWAGCRACSLGERRLDHGAPFTPGEGKRRGLMVIGDAPQIEEEDAARVFAGDASLWFRTLLGGWKISRLYLTYTVACRSCSVITLPTGEPRMFRGYGGTPEVRWRDSMPLPDQVKACRDRLMEEIYTVDPLVIVALGGRVLEALTGRACTSIHAARGKEIHIEVPGLGSRMLLTEKRRQWVRKVRGVEVAPTTPAAVRYLVMPTFPLFFMKDREADDSAESPKRLIARDTYRAVQIYRRMLAATDNIHDQPHQPTLSAEEAAERAQEEMQDAAEKADQ